MHITYSDGRYIDIQEVGKVFNIKVSFIEIKLYIDKNKS